MFRKLSALALTFAAAACTTAAPQPPIAGDLALDEGAFCFSGLEHPFEDFSKGDLISAVTAAKLVDPSIVATMSSGDASRIIDGMAFLGLAEGSSTMADLFAMTDDGEMDMLEFEVGEDGVSGFWLRFYADDAEYGALFIDGRDEPVAIVEDGEVAGCLEIPTELISCSLETNSVFDEYAHSSTELESLSSGSRTVTSADAATLSAREIELLFAAARELDMVDDQDSLSDIFALADEGEISLIGLEWTGDEEDKKAAQWVRFGSGGEEVGVVFANGTTKPLATIDDSDIAGCN